jgi:hypothetical protein|tara:strand:+ start:172 stop:426 length:255 start_codon:yes stop_codon:yes gene_type:complete
MTKRNPCRVSKKEYREDGTHIVELRGYAQERKTFDGVEMTFVMEGGDSGIGLWYPSSEVRITRGKWTNDTGKVVSRKSFWKRSK